MRTLLPKHDYQKATKELEGRFPSPSHVLKMITKSTEARAKDGTVCAVLICNVIPTGFHKLAYELWKSVRELPDNRATAVGSASLLRPHGDGSPGKRRTIPKGVKKILAELKTAHGSVGFLDATPDQPCHKTPLTKDYPEMLEGNKRLIKLVDGLYKHYYRTSYERQRVEIEKVPLWRLWDTVFSTIYIAKNFRTAYHRDSGNLRGVMTALIPMGKFTGGDLVLPRWRIAFTLKPGDLLLFDPQQLHGNLPFVGERLSAAFYCERRIADCGK